METVDSNLDTTDIVSWPEGELRQAAYLLKQEVDFNPIPRQRDVADRNLGRVAFEMWARTHHDVRTPEPAGA